MAASGLTTGLPSSLLLFLVVVVPCPALQPAIRVRASLEPPERIQAPCERRTRLRDLIPLFVEDPGSGRLRGGYVADRSPSPANTNSPLGLSSSDGRDANRVPPLSGLGDRTSPILDWSGDQDFVYSETHGAKGGSAQSGSWSSSSSFTASSWVTDFSTQQDEGRMQWGYSAVPPADTAGPAQPEEGGDAPAVHYAFVPPVWLMERLKRLFAERHGRNATEEEVGEWANALVQARTKQEHARERGQDEDVTVHIAGVLVDMQTGKVATVKKRRPVGRSDRYTPPHASKWQCFQEGCPKRGSFLNPDKSSDKHAACREHAPQSFVSERVLGGHVAKARSNGGHRLQRKRNEFSSSKCGFEGCTVSPSYGDIVAARSPGGTVMFCKQHKLPSHVNVRQPLCQHSSGCKNGALYGKAADRKKVRCFQHMEKGDMNLGASLCQYAGGCSKRAVYGSRSLGRPRHCSSHKMADDIDLVHKLCDFRDGDVICDKQAGYGQPGGGSRRCRLHKGPGYVSVRKRSAHAHEHAHAALPSSSDKDAQSMVCCRCLSSTPAPPPPLPPPTESFYFCMNTPWWSPRGPIPFEETYRQPQAFGLRPLPPVMVAQEGRVPSEYASTDVTFSGDSMHLAA